MNPDQIERVFGALSRIETTVNNFGTAFNQHLQDDKLVVASVTKLQLAQARQRGFMTALSLAAAFISGLIGYVVEYFASGRSSGTH